MEILEWLGKYWLEWLCGLIATGALFFAKHYIKIQRQVNEEKQKDKEQNMCNKIISNFDEKISEIKTVSNDKESRLYESVQAVQNNLEKSDKIIFDDLSNIHGEVDIIESGILSIQGKQFREMCEDLLKQDYITVEEYEEFEEEYAVYKGLGGNHRGDSLHARVVAKVDKQNNKPENNE